MEQIKKNHHYIIFVLISIVYLTFPIKIHQWESYWYAAGLENLYPVSLIHHLFDINIKEHLNFNIFHPNHPLLHLITYGFFKIFPNARALQITQWINILFATLGLFVILKIQDLKKITQKQCSFLLLFLGSTNLYWYYGMSGEVYIAPTAIMISIYYFLLRIEVKLELEEKYFREILAVSILFSLACSFHLIAAPFLIIIILAYFHLKKKYRSFLLGTAFIALFAIGLTFAILVYGVLFIYFTHIKSFHDFFDSLFVLSSIGGSTISYKGSILNFFGYKALTFLNSLIRSNNIFTVFYKITFVLSLFLSFVINISKRSKDLSDLIIFYWLIIYFFIFTVIINVPFNDYWIIVLFPVVFMISQLINHDRKQISFLLVVLVSFQIFFNFKYDIYPKSKATNSDFSILAQNEIPKSDLNFFYFNFTDERFFNEFWYFNYIIKNTNTIIGNERDLVSFIEKEASQKTYKSFNIIAPYPDYLLSPKDFSLLKSGKNHFAISQSNIQFLDKLQSEKCNIFQVERNIFYKSEKLGFEKKAQYPFGYKDSDSKDLLILVLSLKLK
jgi:hypothetical protein